MVWILKKITWPDFLNPVRDWFNRVRQDRNLIIFLIFIVISTGFWFLNALRKEYTSTLSYPVRFVNVPEDKMIPDDFKGRIELKVRAGGFVILRYQLSNSFLPLTFDVLSMNPMPDGIIEGAYMLTSDQQNRIVGQLSQGMELIEISPDTFFVPFIEHRKAKIPVKGNFQFSFEKQFLQGGSVIIKPDSVEISGPKQIVDTMQFVEMRKLVLENLSDTVTAMVPLVLPPRIRASEKRVAATVPVEPFTEMNLRIPLRINGLPDSLRIKMFPPSIQVSFRVGISQYESIDESQFQAVVDVSQVFGEDRSDRLKVRLDQIPQNIEYLSFSPIFVEYLLEK
jgi:hypothetical protein